MRFCDPRPNRAVIALCRKLLPTILRRGYGIVDIEYRPDELKQLRQKLGERILLAPNHPTHAEPAILYDLSRELGVDFAYLSNRESFERVWGLFGWLLRRNGAYSIIRGAPDRDSFKFTRHVLADQVAPLVIFPEGEVYSQNDSLLPFQAGVFQLALLALDDLAKQGFDVPLWVQPVAVHYRFVEDVGREVVASMNRLEEKLALPGPAPGDPYLRLRRIGDAVLSAAEAAYRLPKGDPGDLNPRIERVREKIVMRLAEALHLEAETLGKTLPEKMRALGNRLNRVATDEELPASEYEERLMREEAERVRPLNADLQRLANWLAVRDGYVGELATPERMVDTLWRLESEVMGQRILRGARRCRLRLAPPFDLREYRDTPRKEAIREVTARVETAIQSLLDEMADAP